MGQYIIGYDTTWHHYRHKVRGDRGAILNSERRALQVVRSLLKQGKEGIKYEEVVESENPRKGHIKVTWPEKEEGVEDGRG